MSISGKKLLHRHLNALQGLSDLKLVEASLSKSSQRIERRQIQQFKTLKRSIRISIMLKVVHVRSLGVWRSTASAFRVGYYVLIIANVLDAKIMRIRLSAELWSKINKAKLAIISRNNCLNRVIPLNLLNLKHEFAVLKKNISHLNTKMCCIKACLLQHLMLQAYHQMINSRLKCAQNHIGTFLISKRACKH